MTKNNTPLITVGITCYNAANTITRAIKSAQAQDWDNLEILIVDDCSTDNSRAVVAAAIDNEPRARLITHKTNKGPAGARQTLLDEASGDFIAFFDDDDESLPSRVRTQYNRLTAYEHETGQNLMACYASGTRLYNNGYTLPLNAIGSAPEIPAGEDMAAYLLFYRKHKAWFYGSGVPTCGLMARTDVLKNIGGFDQNLRRVEDVDLAIRLALKGGHFIGCPERLFIQHATNAKDKSPEKNRDSEIKIAEKHKDYLKSQNMYFYAKTWPLLRYYHFKSQYGRFALTLLKLFARHPIKTLRHLLDTGPKRLKHEQKMAAAPSVTACNAEDIA